MSTTNPIHATLDALVIRPARQDDSLALRRLALIDDQRPLTGPALIAEVDGEARAALSLSDRRAIADPFHRTADLVSLLEVRASLLREAPHRTARGPGFVDRARHALAA